jgi:O-glycosyl hydrolase
MKALPTWRGGALLLVAAMAWAGSLAVAAQPTPPASLTLDLQGAGRPFDGFGGLSAGASSRLLYDYPEPERSQILDYLFKPNYGANLQILKVEIGGDSNSTSGSEASHMRSPTDLNGERGYEWWLMKEAKKRNPDIKLWGLEWAAPGWFEGGFWSTNNIEYLLAWLRLAEQQGLKIDYMGGWNERGANPDWYVAWHQALAKQFPQIKIVAADDFARDWPSVKKMTNSPAFRDATDIIGQHDPYGARTGYEHCPVPEFARQLNKTIWDSELSSQGHDTGAIPLARGLNRQYIEGRMTANVVWSLISAWYADLPLADTGLMLADRPWSGYYRVGKSIWVHAHTTQFTRIGWRYIDSACGYLTNGASYVTFKSPDSRDFTTVIETMDSPVAQEVQFHLTGGASPARVQLWSSDLASAEAKDYFVHQGSLRPKGGSFSVRLLPQHLYTLSTTTGQAKGTAQPKARPAEQLPLPYQEDFECYKGPGKLARYFSDIEGGFETATCGGGRTGWCYRQAVPQAPIAWGAARHMPPTTLLGDPRWWGDYEVGADVLLEQEGSVELLGRVSSQRKLGVAGYHFQVTSQGQWTLYSELLGPTDTTLASGRVEFPVGSWHRLGLRFLGRRIEVLYDRNVLTNLLDDQHLTGQVGLRVSRWQNAQFDNVSVVKTAPWPQFVPHAQMRVSATSQHPGNVRGWTYEAANAIDDRPETAWSAEWEPRAPLPQSITLDMGRKQPVQGLVFQPRLDLTPHGHLTEYRIYLSNDGKQFTPVASGTWPVTTATQFAAWPVQSARYVRLEATEGSDGAPAAAELNIATSPLTANP